MLDEWHTKSNEDRMLSAVISPGALRESCLRHQDHDSDLSIVRFSSVNLVFMASSDRASMVVPIT